MKFDKMCENEDYFGLSKAYFYASVLNYGDDLDGFRQFLKSKSNRVYKNAGEQIINIPNVKVLRDISCDESHLIAFNYEETLVGPGQRLDKKEIEEIAGVFCYRVIPCCWSKRTDDINHDNWTSTNFKRWRATARQIKVRLNKLEDFKYFLN